MKQPFFAALALLTFAGCAHGQPTAFERGIYDVTTQRVELVTLKTNYVLLPGTTNLVPTAIVTVTNYGEAYHYTTKPVVTSTISTASGVAGTFGFGWAGALGTLIASALAGWAQYRSSRRAKLNKSLGQSLETSREIMKLQPGGAAREARFMESVKSDQVKAGVKADAADLANTKVDTMEAKETAATVSKTA